MLVDRSGGLVEYGWIGLIDGREIEKGRCVKTRRTESFPAEYTEREGTVSIDRIDSMLIYQ